MSTTAPPPTEQALHYHEWYKRADALIQEAGITPGEIDHVTIYRSYAAVGVKSLDTLIKLRPFGCKKVVTRELSHVETRVTVQGVAFSHLEWVRNATVVREEEL